MTSSRSHTAPNGMVPCRGGSIGSSLVRPSSACSSAPRGRALVPARLAIYALSAVMLFVTSGCAAFRPVRGVPLAAVPEEQLGCSRDHQRTIDPSLLTRSAPPAYLLDQGDVLGVYIEGFLGREGDPPPVNIPLTPDSNPSLGFPIPVREDGTISLPLVGSVPVRGQSITQVENLVRHLFTVNQRIINPDKANIFVSLQKPRQHRVLVIRQEGGSDVLPTSGVGTLSLGLLKRGTGKTVSLPAYKNDVLHALAESGGMPGLDAENAVYVIRRRSPAVPRDGWSQPLGAHDPQAPGEPIVRGQNFEESSWPVAPPNRRPSLVPINGPTWSPPAMPSAPPAPVWPAAGWEQAAQGDVAGATTAPRAAYGSADELTPRTRPATGIVPVQYTTTQAIPIPARQPMAAPSLPSDLRTPGYPGLAPAMAPPAMAPPAQGPILSAPAYAAPLPPGPALSPNSLPAMAPPDPRSAMPGPNPHMSPPIMSGAPVAPSNGQLPLRDELPSQGWPDSQWPGFDAADDGPLDPRRVIRIPIRLAPGETVDLNEEDITLNDGDIVFIESRETEVFYTGGLLGGGQFTLPRDYDLDVLGAIAIAQGSRVGAGIGKSASAGGTSAINQDVTISASRVVILRKTPDGSEIPIEVNIYEALRNPHSRPRILPGDYILLQYTCVEAVGAFIERHLLEGALFGLAAAQFQQGGN